MIKEELYIFEWLSNEEISYFTLMSEIQVYKKWDKIISEWDASNDKAYIIESWSVEIFKAWERIAGLWKWELFWEIALIVNEARTATVIASEQAEVLVLRKDDFLMLYQKSGQYQIIKDKILERIKNNFYGIKE